MKPIKNTFVSIALIALAGCSSGDITDLQNWTENLYRGQTPDVEPLPVIPPYESFVYTASVMSDPFEAANLSRQRKSNNQIGGGPQPISDRRKEPLEQYPLDSLVMVGTLSRNSNSWVILRAPDDTIHRAKPGNYMGESHGMITQISEEKIDVRELIQGPNGNWLERKATVAINQ